MGTDAPPALGLFKKSAANYIPAAISSFYIVVFWACLVFIFSHSRRSPLCVCDMQKETWPLVDRERERKTHSHHYSKRRRGASLGSLDLLGGNERRFSHAYEHNRAEIDSICGSEHRS